MINFRPWGSGWLRWNIITNQTATTYWSVAVFKYSTGYSSFSPSKVTYSQIFQEQLETHAGTTWALQDPAFGYEKVFKLDQTQAQILETRFSSSKLTANPNILSLKMVKIWQNRNIRAKKDTCATLATGIVLSLFSPQFKLFPNQTSQSQMQASL